LFPIRLGSQSPAAFPNLSGGIYIGCPAASLDAFIAELLDMVQAAHPREAIAPAGYLSKRIV
jgi:hypothetical protein